MMLNTWPFCLWCRPLHLPPDSPPALTLPPLSLTDTLTASAGCTTLLPLLLLPLLPLAGCRGRPLSDMELLSLLLLLLLLLLLCCSSLANGKLLPLLLLPHATSVLVPLLVPLQLRPCVAPVPLPLLPLLLPPRVALVPRSSALMLEGHELLLPSPPLLD